jgi:hypothetical protein
MKTTSFRIDIANSAILCAPGAGHARGQKGDKLRWDSRYDFSLRFALISGTGDPTWPFQEPKAPPNEVEHFEGTLELRDENDPPAYKYTVMVDGYVPLDPIIIVDKK